MPTKTTWSPVSYLLSSLPPSLASTKSLLDHYLLCRLLTDIRAHWKAETFNTFLTTRSARTLQCYSLLLTWHVSNPVPVGSMDRSTYSVWLCQSLLVPLVQIGRGGWGGTKASSIWGNLLWLQTCVPIMQVRRKMWWLFTIPLQFLQLPVSTCAPPTSSSASSSEWVSKYLYLLLLMFAWIRTKPSLARRPSPPRYTAVR